VAKIKWLQDKDNEDGTEITHNGRRILSGNPAVIAPKHLRPVILRPSLLTSLPFAALIISKRQYHEASETRNWIISR
jgi:hypothetical protein